MCIVTCDTNLTALEEKSIPTVEPIVSSSETALQLQDLDN